MLIEARSHPSAVPGVILAHRAMPVLGRTRPGLPVVGEMWWRLATSHTLGSGEHGESWR